MKQLKATNSGETFPSSRIYWTRFCFGIAAGLVCGILRLGFEGLALGTSLYFGSFPILRFAYHISLGRRLVRAFYTLGLGTYLAVWFTTWILLNTLKA